VFISQFFRAKVCVEDILIFEWIFCCWKFETQIAKKLGLEGKMSSALNVFTLGPTTH
jgi:hypothetical protein